MTTNIAIFGEHEPNTLAQLYDVASRAERAALMADGHLGYVMPIGGVAAYTEQVSVVGGSMGDDAVIVRGTAAPGTPIETLVIGAFLYLLLSTWKEGRALLASRLRERLYPFARFMQDIASTPPHRVPGTAVFMTSNLVGTPPTLLHNLEHNHVLHDRVILLTVVTSDIPHVAEGDRFGVEPLRHGFFRVTLRYGFMEEPDVPGALLAGAEHRLPIDVEHTTFFLGVETLLSTHREGMARWRERLFALMSRNAVRATSFFRIPAERVVELGMQIEL